MEETRAEREKRFLEKDIKIFQDEIDKLERSIEHYREKKADYKYALFLLESNPDSYFKSIDIELEK
jgi:predicted ribosome quality control (RQC) complex YloA/Tae2 family protein